MEDVLFGVDVSSIEIAPLAAQTYPMAHWYFNTAALGLVSVEAAVAARDYVYGWGGALRSVRECFSAILMKPVEYISAFHNTTAAAQRVLSKIMQHRGYRDGLLLTTDLEYPGIIAMMDDSWQGSVAVVEVAQLAWEGRFDELMVTLKQAVLLMRPSVVFVSHIARSLGCQLLNENLLVFIRSVDPRTIIVIDGAQSIGNIEVDSNVVQQSDFYLCGGHKWLCCPPTIGIVCSHPRWDIADPAQAYSRELGSGGTGSIDVLRAAATSLQSFCGETDSETIERQQRGARHNRALASLFCSLTRTKGIRLRFPGMASCQTIRCGSGIVVMQCQGPSLDGVFDTSGDIRRIEQVAQQGKVMAARLRSERWVTLAASARCGSRLLVRRVAGDLIPQTVDFCADGVCAPIPPGKLLRVCFHHYHSSDDVRRLVSRLQQVQEEGERRSPSMRARQNL